MTDKPVVVTSQEERRIQLQELMPQSNQIIIVHNGEDYRLRITRNGKLILTK
ncbi:hemin uptake protein HemP [Aliamphritea spongicola]|uniref:hemin uptake protein HemP n=1 Tax=Aliamphritea spongicola TaxID=707589 RepID=UPI00196A6DDC|nr:hemin uptake protein HemP [Aliamphritea spongicola]MBN3564345.1 hemin uptake protein HemP [Aliamphritea spongicola]